MADSNSFMPGFCSPDFEHGGREGGKMSPCSSCDHSSPSSHFLFQHTMLMIMLLFSVFLSLLMKSHMSWRDFSESFAQSVSVKEDWKSNG